VIDLLRREAEAEAGMQELGVPGFSLWVLTDGEEDGFGLGITSVDHPLPVDPDTIFQAGSITKTLTATAALRRWFDDHGWGDDSLERFVATFDRLPQLTPSREVWSYNNAGFCLAGRVLEVVAGMPYEEVVRAHVWPDALFMPWEVMTRRFPAGHVTIDGRVEVAEPWAIPRAAGPAGRWLASARTLVEYGRMHLEDSSLAALREPLLETQPGEQMGLAWWR
jgi:CubicO group peptidase (beta-lactamase class C family)